MGLIEWIIVFYSSLSLLNGLIIGLHGFLDYSELVWKISVVSTFMLKVLWEGVSKKKKNSIWVSHIC